MTYPLLPAALAAERIADLHRAATRRRIVLAALRVRRRPAVAPDPHPSARATVVPCGNGREHLCDPVTLVADVRSMAQPEGSSRV